MYTILFEIDQGKNLIFFMHSNEKADNSELLYRFSQDQ